MNFLSKEADIVPESEWKTMRIVDMEDDGKCTGGRQKKCGGEHQLSEKRVLCEPGYYAEKKEIKPAAFSYPPQSRETFRDP